MVGCPHGNPTVNSRNNQLKALLVISESAAQLNSPDRREEGKLQKKLMYQKTEAGKIPFMNA